MPRSEFLGERVKTFMERGYAYTYFPRSLRATIVNAARELGFSTLGDLIRVAVREYLERRGYIKRREEAITAT